MESDLAKKVAGTFVEDKACTEAGTLKYLTQLLRIGALAEATQAFAAQQDEYLDPKLLIVESVAADVVTCRIPFKGDDHESPHPFESQVQFTVDLARGCYTRL